MSTISRSTPGAGLDAATERAISKAKWRLMPLILLLYFIAFVDRVNVSFAALTMNKDLGLTPYVYGWGAGVFFVGYVLFEVPSNWALVRLGARRWIARIMFSWGLASMLMAASRGPGTFLDSDRGAYNAEAVSFWAGKRALPGRAKSGSIVSWTTFCKVAAGFGKRARCCPVRNA